MRVGRNPAKSVGGSDVAVHPPPGVTVGLLTHVPYLAGYHAEQLDVIRLAVLSARANAGTPIHLMVCDNGSCVELREWLTSALDDRLIDQLVLHGRNVGKVTAVSQIIGGAPAGTVIYADGDLRFEPGWVTGLLEVADRFPEAGVVGGAPHLAGTAAVDPGDRSGPAPVPPDITVDRGRFVDPEWLDAFLADTGFVGAELVAQRERVLAADDVRVTRGDLGALWGATHCMFLVTPEGRRRFVPIVGRAALSPGEDDRLDRVLADSGLWKLSVQSAVFRHVGNRLSDEDRTALASLESRPQPGGVATLGSGAPPLQRVLALTPVRRLVRRLHHWSFRVLAERPPGRSSP